MDILHWFCVLLLMLVNIYRVNGDEENSTVVSILFVNDMGYSFYPVTSEGAICKKDEEDCKGGLARLAKKLEELYPPPEKPAVTTTTEELSTSEELSIINNPKSKEEVPFSDFILPYSFDLPSNALFLNVGNFLQSTSNWYDLLKFQPAVEALKCLNFTAIAPGVDVFNYGVMSASYLIESLKEKLLAANIHSNNTDGPSFAKGIADHQTFNVSDNIHITVIGFTDGGDGKLLPTGINIEEPVKAVTDVIKKRKAESKGKDIFIAIGSVETIEVAKNIAEIEEMSLVICSGISGVEYKDGIYSNEVAEGSKWIISSEVGPTHHLLGQISLTIKEDGTIKFVNSSSHDYMNIGKTDDKTVLEVEEKGINELISIKESPAARSQVTLNASETCLETVLGDLVADAMLKAIAGKSDGRIAVWSCEGIPSKKIDPEKDFTVEDIYNILFTGHDENIYSVNLNAKQLHLLLEDNLHLQNGTSCTSLQISGLLVEYADWADKGKKIQKISNVISNMTLQMLDLANEKDLIEIAVSSSFLSRSKLDELSPPKDLGVTVGEAVTNYIKTSASGTNYVKLSPLGLRYMSVSKPPSIAKCQDNAGEAVLLTLAVIVIIVALGLLIWYVVIPRVRQRRGSAMPLIY